MGDIVTAILEPQTGTLTAQVWQHPELGHTLLHSIDIPVTVSLPQAPSQATENFNEWLAATSLRLDVVHVGG